MKRQHHNKILLQILSSYIDAYPTQRFGQALFNLGIVQRKPNSLDIMDPFYEEPIDTLKRITNGEEIIHGEGDSGDSTSVSELPYGLDPDGRTDEEAVQTT